MNIKNKKDFIIMLISLTAACITIISSMYTLLNHANISYFLRSIAYQKEPFSINYTFSIICFLEVILLVSVLLIAKHLVVIPVSNETEKRRLLSRNLRNLYNGIRFITVSWTILYSWLFIAWSGIFYSFSLMRNKSFIWVVSDILHATTIIGFFYTFLTLSYPLRRENQIRKQLLYNRRILTIYITITLCILSFSTLGRLYELGFDKIGVILLAFLSGISMQFFIGALDGIYFDRKRILLVPLYIYVHLQIVWVTIDGYDSSFSSKVIILVTALMCKIAFYYILIRWTKRFAIYINDQIQ